MAFVGNTSHDVSYMVRNTDLFEDFPTVYHDPAFLDRIHAYIPGWEMDIIRGDMFCEDFGFIVDYLAEALKAMRPLDYSGDWQGSFELHPTLSTRDRDGVKKTYSGLKKIIFPGMEPTDMENAELLETALELRERVKDQLYRIDETFDHVSFAYRHRGGDWVEVHTLEEDQWPSEYHKLDLSQTAKREKTAEDSVVSLSGQPSGAAEGSNSETASAEQNRADNSVLREGHVKYRENQRGISYESLFGAYFDGATTIRIIDPYIRNFYQARNLMELLEVIVRHNYGSSSAVDVHLTTAPDEFDSNKQENYLSQIQEAVEPQNINFTWELTQGGIHARHLLIDDKWDILLDRGLDIFQRFDANNAFALESAMPEMRRVKQFEVVYMKEESK
jgi:ATP-dependent Lon protease